MAYPFLSQSLPSVGRGAALDLSNEVDELLDDDELANQEVRRSAERRPSVRNLEIPP
jgi:hypothetical protein